MYLAMKASGRRAQVKIRAASLIVLAALCLSIISRTTFIHAQDAPNLIAQRVL
jgi:hypothetical protein